MKHLTSPQRGLLAVAVMGMVGFFLFSPSATATITVINSFPYTASQTGTNFSETLLVAGTNLSTSGSALNINGHDIVVYLVNDTITFGTDNGDGYYGIQLNYSSYNIKIIGGTIYHGGTGDRNVCLRLVGTNDVLIEGTDMRVAGTNGHCVFSPSLGEPGNYNIEVSGGHYRSDVTGYTNRCNYDGCAMWFGTTYRGYGDYHFKIHGINLITGPSQGLVVTGRSGGNEALVFIYACTLQSDARNYFYTSGDNTCFSAANPYQLVAGRLAGGSEIHDNVITSGTNYGGSRGIIMEMCAGTPDNYVKVYNNYVDVHEGPNLEESEGLVQVLRMRFGNKYVHVYDNVFIGTGSRNHGSSYGGEVAVFRLTATDEEGHVPDHGIIIERNLFRAQALSDNVAAWAGVFESFPGVGNIYRYNRFESSGSIICFGETNHGADGIMLLGDTLVRLTPSYNPKTVVVGWRDYFSASNDTLRDCVFLGGASDDDIVFDASGSDYRLERTLAIRVLGNNGLPVPGASVRVVNNYGNTVINGTTDGNGFVIGAVAYRWEQNPGADSTDFNDFTVTAVKNSDTTRLTFTVNATSTSPTLTLAATPGEEPTDDTTPPGQINLNAVPGAAHGEIDLNWTAPGDDGYTGTANHYVIKYSSTPITDANWTQATTVPNPPAPAAAGTAQSMTITGLEEGRQYYVAIKAYDENNNESPLSNVPQSFAAGIAPPSSLQAWLDTYGASVTLTCGVVSSYHTLKYQFALDTMVTFPTPRLADGNIGGSTVSTLFGSLLSMTYYWRCRAIADDNSDTSAWSSIQTFTFNTNNPPTVPNHLTPANGDSITADPIVLVVENAVDPDGDALVYDFWLSTDSAFTAVVDSVKNVPEGTGQTSATFSQFTPQEGQRYWWRCRAGDGSLWSSYSTPTSFVWVKFSSGGDCDNPPSLPTLFSPKDGSGVNTAQPTLCITNSTPAQGCLEPQMYIFEIYGDSILTTPVIPPTMVSEELETTCFTVPTPLPSGRYYWWRVRCFNGTAYSEWAGPFTFHTPNVPPEAPALLSPRDGDTVSTVVPALTVETAVDPDGTPLTYFFEVSQYADFSAIAASGSVYNYRGSISWTVKNELQNNSGYYWRARAYDGIAFSDYSEPTSFYIDVGDNTPPSPPTVLSPTNGSTVDTTQPTLMVLNGSDSDGDELTYEFEVYNHSDELIASVFGVAEGSSSTGWTVTTALTDSAVYYWRARCYDGSELSAWTPLIEFTVLLSQEANEPPSLPVPILPALGDTVMFTPIVLLIENSIDPDGDNILYDFWVYSDASLTQVVQTKFDVPQTPTQTSALFDFQPINGHRYWWQVRAKDGQHVTALTSPMWFVFNSSTTGQDDYMAAPSGPENGSVVLTNKPTLAATNIAAAGDNYYYFEVANDSNFFSPVVSSPPVAEEEGGVTHWRVSEELASGETYYWRVRVNNYAYSPVAQFTVDYQIYASPNPVHFRRGEYVTFHLPDEPVDLFIQTVSGETVQLVRNVSGDWRWEGLNNSGRQVAVGIYLWYVPGTPYKGKIMVKP